MKWKTLFRPAGCIVPSLKIFSTSNCFRLKLAPECLLRPLTAMSDRLWPGELKCSATGNYQCFFRMLRRCLPKRSRRVQLVSPMYSLGHRRHKMQYTTFPDLQVKRSRMVVELLGPHTWTLDNVYRQVRQWGCQHGKVPGSSLCSCQSCVLGHIASWDCDKVQLQVELGRLLQSQGLSSVCWSC